MFKLHFNLRNFLVIASFLVLNLRIVVCVESEKSEPHHRQKRYFYFDTNTPAIFGVTFFIPLTFALPTWNKNSARRLRREVYIQDYECNMTADDILPINSYDDPAYNQELTKILNYFSALEVDQDVCQQRVICEVFTDPKFFSPLSDLLINKLTVDHGVVAENSSSRYYRYVRAMQNGVAGGDLQECHKLYSKCPYSSLDRLHMESMRFWSFIMSTLRMTLFDD